MRFEVWFGKHRSSDLHAVCVVTLDTIFADFLDHSVDIGLKPWALQIEFAGEL